MTKQRQAITTTPQELFDLAYKLVQENIHTQIELDGKYNTKQSFFSPLNWNQKVLITIINKTTESDTWKFE